MNFFILLNWNSTQLKVTERFSACNKASFLHNNYNYPDWDCIFPSMNIFVFGKGCIHSTYIICNLNGFLSSKNCNSPNWDLSHFCKACITYVAFERFYLFMYWSNKFVQISPRVKVHSISIMMPDSANVIEDRLVPRRQ